MIKLKTILPKDPADLGRVIPLGILFEEFFDENNKFDYISFTYKKENL